MSAVTESRRNETVEILDEARFSLGIERRVKTLNTLYRQYK
jgi:hypothetical protein